MELAEPTIKTSFEEYKRMASELLQALPGATFEEASNGFKCLSLAYFGLRDLSELESLQAVEILNLAGTKVEQLDPAAINAAKALATLKRIAGVPSFNDDDWYVYEVTTKKVVDHYGSKSPRPKPKPGQEVTKGMNARWLELIQ